MVRDHRMIVMFFDLTSLQAEDLLRSTRAAQKYLQEQMTPADLVGVVAFGNTLKVVANFTNDRELLKQSVDALVPGHEAALASAGRCGDSCERGNRRHGRHRRGIHGRRHGIQYFQYGPETRRRRSASAKSSKEFPGRNR